MKKLYVYLLGVVFIVWPFVVAGQPVDIPDSLLTLDHVYEYTFSDYEKAKEIVQRMRKRKLSPVYMLDIVEGDLHFNNRKIKDALVFYKRALESDSVRNSPVDYMEQIHRMISCYDDLNDVDKMSEYIQLLLDTANEYDNKEMKSIALFNRGRMLYHQQDKERGYQLMNEAVEVMKASDYKYKYNNLRFNYHTLQFMLQRDGRYEEALAAVDSLASIVTTLTKEEGYMENRDNREMMGLLARRASILSFMDRVEEADEAFDQWAAIETDSIRDLGAIPTPYLLRTKRFDKVIEIFDPLERFYRQNSDTITYSMKTVKRLIGKAYEGKKDYVNATKYYRELAMLVDSLKEREQRSNAVELAIAYETHEKELKLQEQATHIKVRNSLLLSAGLAIFLLLIILWRKIKFARIIRYKNKVMAGTIEDLLVHKEELFEAREEVKGLKEKLQALTSAAGADGDESATGPIPDDETGEGDSYVDRLLFEKLDNIVVREKLYLNPDLSREDLMKLIRVNKNRLGQILHQYTGSNTTTYINNKRLDYAARLLKTHSGYTIAGIAASSGIPNVRTFQRLFKAKFGMTPTEFINS